jgi:hypothetical protein
MDISLNAVTKCSIERSTGIPYAEIEKLDAEEIGKLIEKNKRRLIVRDYQRDSRLPFRGSVLLSLGRYIKMSDIDKQLGKI